MKYAICNYERGKQMELSADDINKNYYGLHFRKFFCPECGEKVTYVNRLSDPHFKHSKKTDATPECDKRQDGRADLSVYERVGLPLYIKKESQTKFSLNIGFWSLSESALQNAEKSQLCVKVKSKNAWQSENNEVKYYISSTRFSSKMTTLIPLDFIPKSGINLSIEYEPSHLSSSVKRKWSDYADGFAQAGALFDFAEECGKKIKRGDSVTIGKEYYWVTSNNRLPHLHALKSELIGDMVLNKTNFNVFRVLFDDSIRDDMDFDSLANYLRDYLFVNLLYAVPEIIPLWPPCIKHGESFVATPLSSQIISTVKTSNEKPKVFEYFGGIPREVHICNCNNNYLVQLPVNTVENLITVDRKYVGSGVFLSKQIVEYPPNQYEINISLTDGIPITAKSVVAQYKFDELNIQSNVKSRVFLKYTSEIFEKKSINSNEVIHFRNIEYLEEIIVATATRDIKRIRMTKKLDDTSYKMVNDAELYNNLIRFTHGFEVQLPLWIKCFLSELNINSKSHNLVKKYCTAGKIPYKALVYIGNNWRH